VLESDIFFYISALGDPDHPLVNENDLDLTIFAHDLQIFDSQKNPVPISIKDIVQNNYPLLKLRKGEEFHFRGQVARGIGHYHATFKGAIVAYKFENAVSLKPPTKKQPTNPITGQVLETIPDKRNFPTNRLGNPEHISLTIKPIGHYEPKACFQLALDTIEQKLRILQNLLNDPKHFDTTRVTIMPDANIPGRVLIKVHDLKESEDFLASNTIIELVTRHMFYKASDMINNDPEALLQMMTSCKREHRLHPIMTIDIKPPSTIYPKSEDPAIQLFNETIENLLSYIAILRKETPS
jgi:hypothetical protein